MLVQPGLLLKLATHCILYLTQYLMIQAFTKLCRLVDPWESVSEIQSIKETSYTLHAGLESSPPPVIRSYGRRCPLVQVFLPLAAFWTVPTGGKHKASVKRSRRAAHQQKVCRLLDGRNTGRNSYLVLRC